MWQAVGKSSDRQRKEERERGGERGMSEGSVEFKERAVRGLAALV